MYSTGCTSHEQLPGQSRSLAESTNFYRLDIASIARQVVQQLEPLQEKMINFHDRLMRALSRKLHLMTLNLLHSVSLSQN